MEDLSPTTRRYLGWSFAGISFFHAMVLLWGAATWSRRLREALEVDYGELAPYVQENLSSRGAPVEFLMAVLAALAGVGWLLLAHRGRVPAFFDDWRGGAALIGGGTVALAYAVMAVVPFINIVSPREVERIPSWDALGGWGDMVFVLMFAIDALVIALWTIERWHQPEVTRGNSRR